MVSCPLTKIEASSFIVISRSDCASQKTSLQIDVSFPIYLIGIMSFISWFFFVIFGGIGLTALPMDLIHEFKTRPKQMTKQVYDALKQSVISRAIEMRNLASSLKQIEAENPNLMKATSILDLKS